MRDAYMGFSHSAPNYRIIFDISGLMDAIADPRYWRVVATPHGAVEMLRVPVQVKNRELAQIEKEYGLRIATQDEITSAFTAGNGHHYKYPWGNTPDASRAPELMRVNPMGMGMNMAGIYFNGPDNIQCPEKNGLWMVMANGYRCGGAGNVGIFPPVNADAPEAPVAEGSIAGQRGGIAGERGLLAGERGLLAGERGVMGEAPNRLTPAGIGYGEELHTNEGYVMVRPLSASAQKLYERITTFLTADRVTLLKKVGADGGIPLISIGDISSFSGTSSPCPVICFGVVGHCLNCPNAASITTPLNGPSIADATGIPVVEYPEFAHHRVRGTSAIIPEGVDMQQAGHRVYFPHAMEHNELSAA